MGFLDKAKAAAASATEKAKEGVSDVQTKREIGQVYDELGKKAHELVESGAVSHPELQALVDKIKELQAKLEDESDSSGNGASGDGGTTATAEPPASSAPPAMPN